jgi:lipoprotein-anchoring transpeptidase ErfK/SrfK
MNFGTVMSHGCVNMRTDDALWLYRWTVPVIKIEDWDKQGFGTQVTVH